MHLFAMPHCFSCSCSHRQLCLSYAPPLACSDRFVEEQQSARLESERCVRTLPAACFARASEACFAP